MTERTGIPDKDDIWYNLSGYSKWHKMRIMENVDTPKFISPVQKKVFIRGNQECICICKTKYLPRNAILIRPLDQKKSVEIYKLMIDSWKKGRFQFLSHGTCQHFINTYDVKKEFREVSKEAKIYCTDNVDNSTLKPGDILLTRHGEQLIGKPHLILKD